MKISQLLLAAIAAASMLAPATRASAQDDKIGQLSQRLDELEAEVRQVHAAFPPPAVAGWRNGTSIGGRIYFDVSSIMHDSDGGKTPDSGVGFDLKRFYISIDHVFNDMFMADITTDATYDSTIGTSQIFIKKAYLQMALDPALTFRFGSAEMPWITYAEGINGYRYVDPSLIDRTKFGTSADWGVHAMGSFFDGVLSYDLAGVNGGTYRKIPSGAGTNRFKQLDFEGRVSLAYHGFNLAAGGYTGKLGQSFGVTTYHTADRFDALAAYVADGVRVGVEYFNANDWTAVTKPAPDSAHGWSGFGSWAFRPPFSIFARYDYVMPNGKTVALLQEHYYNAGLSWTASKGVDFALTFKHEEASHGSISTAAGTIGGSVNGGYNEVGVFSGVQF